MKSKKKKFSPRERAEAYADRVRIECYLDFTDWERLYRAWMAGHKATRRANARTR